MDEKLRLLRVEMASWRRAGKRVFPEPMRWRAIALTLLGRERGLSTWRVAQELGLGVQALQGWIEEGPRGFRAASVESGPGAVAGPVVVTRHGHRIERVTDAPGNVTEYGFDASGNMVPQEDALHRMTHYEFDEAGPRTARVLHLQQRETSSYDIDGALRTRVDFMGRATEHLDDDHDGRMDEVNFANDPSVTTQYWGDGQRSKVMIAGGASVTCDRSGERGDLSLVAHSSGTDIAYVQDSAGQRVSLTTDPAGQAHPVLYDHDAAGRMTRIWDGFRRLVDPLDIAEVPTCDVPAPEACSVADHAMAIARTGH